MDACCAASSTRANSGVNVRLARPAAADFRLLGDFGVVGRRRGFRIAAGSLDQAGRGAFFVIQQRLQQVFGGDALVELADRDGARGLQEALATFR